MGFPVLGDTNDVNRLFNNKVFDCAIISISTNLVLRRSLFNRFASIGVSFVNAIDPNVVIHSNVKIGTGNIIIAGSRIGTCAEIRDNNFFSAFANIEHHNYVGSHNTFGPSVVFSSRVTVEDSCRFGTGIFVEPGVRIGSSSVVSSGSILRSSLEPGSTVKTKYMQQITISNENTNV
jgi:acetyltransferase-like isoleucine patch superfamily enzyme